MKRAWLDENITFSDGTVVPATIVESVNQRSSFPPVGGENRKKKGGQLFFFVFLVVKYAKKTLLIIYSETVRDYWLTAIFEQEYGTEISRIF